MSVLELPTTKICELIFFLRFESYKLGHVPVMSQMVENAHHERYHPETSYQNLLFLSLDIPNFGKLFLI